MKTYQKILLLIVLIFCGAVLIMGNLTELKNGAKVALKSANLMTVCDDTLYYSLGNIDPRFGVSNEFILKSVKEAEGVWEKELNKNVLEFKEGAEFKINFIFDERQEQAIEKNKLDSQLDKLEEIKGGISKEYDKLELEYQNELLAYQKNVRDYERRVDEFNEEVEKWNKKGGAPKDEYEDLEKEQKALEKIRTQLEAQRRLINAKVADLNELAKRSNVQINNYNEKIQTYQDKFGESNEFNQGEYNGTGINIYQFHESTDLKLVLAHELGHALGVGHVENSSSIMYYLMEKQDLENIRLTDEDLGAIRGICGID
ncbi:MAG: Peptidase M10A and M12B matrixin and adamalysin [Candidatus Moranbacteria bacterium GW2011_GWF2_34_56]|nr:MAG: Peptidase M10A and M12B matrixin and adamalysin [Candidatus Moranbacteria bacterium GW2011_GWF1_34_10]KKP63438.1 MAG: Peptidase M10A and M12B matrixin and adamalysin [Candidatus Moranbacteria bacterium GW2011_GWF2_34_56]